MARPDFPGVGMADGRLPGALRLWARDRVIVHWTISFSVRGGFCGWSSVGRGGIGWGRGPGSGPGRVCGARVWPSPHRIRALIIPLPIRDIWIVLLPPCPHPLVHHALPQGGHHREGGHGGVAVGQLGRGVGVVALQQREAAVGFVVVVGMALQVDQQPV